MIARKEKTKQDPRIMPVTFPKLSERNLSRFLSKIGREISELTSPEYEINAPHCALWVGWDSERVLNGISVSEIVDSALASIMGIQETRDYDNPHNDPHGKKYLYRRDRRLFLLNGDNCYGGPNGDGSFYHRLLLTWRERVQDKPIMSLCGD